ncbi:hypothetical protein OC834_003738 [Tilletia horrida]|nr:hypothetical protein OC834_003738 [Tilletia horrida]
MTDAGDGLECTLTLNVDALEKMKGYDTFLPLMFHEPKLSAPMPPLAPPKLPAALDSLYAEVIELLPYSCASVHEGVRLTHGIMTMALAHPSVRLLVNDPCLQCLSFFKHIAENEKRMKQRVATGSMIYAVLDCINTMVEKLDRFTKDWVQTPEKSPDMLAQWEGMQKMQVELPTLLRLAKSELDSDRRGANSTMVPFEVLGYLAKLGLGTQVATGDRLDATLEMQGQANLLVLYPYLAGIIDEEAPGCDDAGDQGDADSRTPGESTDDDTPSFAPVHPDELRLETLEFSTQAQASRHRNEAAAVLKDFKALSSDQVSAALSAPSAFHFLHRLLVSACKAQRLDMAQAFALQVTAVLHERFEASSTTTNRWRLINALAALAKIRLHLGQKEEAFRESAEAIRLFKPMHSSNDGESARFLTSLQIDHTLCATLWLKRSLPNASAKGHGAALQARHFAERVVRDCRAILLQDREDWRNHMLLSRALCIHGRLIDLEDTSTRSFAPSTARGFEILAVSVKMKPLLLKPFYAAFILSWLRPRKVGPEVLPILDTAASAFEQGGDERRRFRATLGVLQSLRGTLLPLVGRFAEAVVANTKAMALNRRSAPLVQRAVLHLAWASYKLGRYEVALQVLDQMQVITRRQGEKEYAAMACAHALSAIAIWLIGSGTICTGVVDVSLKQAIRLFHHQTGAPNVGDNEMVTELYTTSVALLGVVQCLQGDLASASKNTTLAINLILTSGTEPATLRRSNLARALTLHAFVLLRSGECGEAKENIFKAIQLIKDGEANFGCSDEPTKKSAWLLNAFLLEQAGLEREATELRERAISLRCRPFFEPEDLRSSDAIRFSDATEPVTQGTRLAGPTLFVIFTCAIAAARWAGIRRT